MAYEKLLNEIYAAVSLKYLWKEYEPYFVKSESPDWINPNMDFGLEVSQALLPDDGRFWAILPDNTVQQDYLSKAKYRFDRKLEKLNANYIHKHYNGLYLFLHPTDENDIDAGALFEYMRYTQEKKKMRFDRVFLNCVKTIYVCNYENNTIEPIVLPPNAENFLNTEAEYLRNCCDWKDGTALEMKRGDENRVYHVQ